MDKDVEERFERIERNLDRMAERMDKHIEFVGQSLDRLTEQVHRTAAAQEVTEQRLQELIAHVDGIDGRVNKLEKDDRRE